jgi:hypothetical protein
VLDGSGDQLFTSVVSFMVPIEEEAEWIPEQVWIFREEKNLLPLPGLFI